MVTKEELGGPVERLREQMEKLQLHSAKVVMLEQQLAMAEERVRRLEAEKQARAEQAERSVSTHLPVAFPFTLTFIVLIHYREFPFVQIVDLQQRAVLKGQDSDALRRRAENAEREVRRLRKRCSLCINMYWTFSTF